MRKNLFALLLVLLLAACSGAPAVQQISAGPTQDAGRDPSITVTDALGRQVNLARAPERIVVTGKAWNLVLNSVYMFPEARTRLAGMGNAAASQGSTGKFIALVDPGYTSRAVLDQDVSVDQIAAVKPDLVILKSYLSETLGKSIEPLNIPVVYVDFETPEQYTRDLGVLGKVFDNEARAAQVAGYYEEKTAAVQSAAQAAGSKPQVLMLYYNDKDGAVAFNVPPMAWIQTRLVLLAGGEPAWKSANPGSGWTKVNLEQIAAWDADQIFIISYFKNPSEVVASLKNDPQWQAMRAVQQGRLYAFPADFYSWDQADARWILGLTWLAGRLHPEAFPKLDIVQEAKQFYQTLYGLDANIFEADIRPAFKGDLP